MPVSRPLRTFGRVLQGIREAKGRVWTQKHVAKLANLNHFSVSKAETDKPKITVDTYNKICKVLGTTLEAVVADMDPAADLPESVRAFLGDRSVGNSAVRFNNRTRYDEPETLDNTWTRLPTATEGEEPGPMPDDPNFASLKNFWPHLDDSQRAEVVAVAAKIYGHRKRAVGESPGKG